MVKYCVPQKNHLSEIVSNLNVGEWVLLQTLYQKTNGDVFGFGKFSDFNQDFPHEIMSLSPSYVFRRSDELDILELALIERGANNYYLEQDF